MAGFIQTGGGFSVSLMEGKNIYFPTTGFKGAIFSLIGSGSDQSIYECESSNDGAEIALSATLVSGGTRKGCEVTFLQDKKSTRDIEIEMYEGNDKIGVICPHFSGELF